ncbi:MAG: GTP-binding protein TypA [Deltaproteobacteria bacterium RIFCSPLOWO2_01_44_7]|nr:MAG: GTP-binding protein TypA [Deltaproteobacteria bacterium RIFCSPHIGHO2_01_FULL_43_49]OGQ14668.1 MAG: GTP-binding protein TypA [Deltaproteobacteria bacterium RIFCSPHIGHO2_02_FULL_44_53]OGQ28054.1 MAG: GTP-binding protein TypA [Deltaproteobacteria bacterium RIFCSPHIGHO2_12_FULL_44_21]OGQ31266.1 MAG: GTP-binding protein TypA [Deltaproteobacteria bacterium RIFCSPLOWO2_01_FULL_45_74]OGQ40377.1 MAG: GTP-binding protein TypA [Deltaproteobacteria bacterium RIFCSPLOWO2_01_44_7]OGQ43258.1 MAG: GTP
MKELATNKNLRNVAIIAHVDHGKTTLVDFMLRQSGTFRENQAVNERVMDSMDLERERGITIASKNCSIYWNDVKINIIDTPGHADFGGEVERGLKMVDGAILLVDASEGPLPQTRFVLKKALEAHLKIVVVINKIDRKDARPQEVLNEVYSLFIDLDADDKQIEFPVLYAIGREGIVQKTLEGRGKNLSVLFETIIDEVPPPRFDPKEPFQMLVTNLSYSDYLGRLAIGRVFNGMAKQNDNLVCIAKDTIPRPLKVSKLQVYDGIRFGEVDSVEPGEIVILSGIENVEIGDTICTVDTPKALKRITVDEPTVSMKFMINTSPFSGRDGKFVQSRKILERLQKETLHNVALRVEEDKTADSFIVKGRGEFQMAILIETMRREGFEVSVGRPQVILKEENGVQVEPIEHLYIDIQEDFTGIVTEKLSRRLGRMINMVNHGTGRVRLEFSIPSRGLIGYRNEFLTDTKGTGLMNSYLQGYEPYRGDIKSRVNGSLVSDRSGETVAYGLFHLEPRGVLFVEPGVPVYEGMIVGENNRENDLNINPCRTKKLSNMRAAGKDENIILSPVVPMTLERAIEFIRDDEQVEVTPKNIRLRKNILSASSRK